MMKAGGRIRDTIMNEDKSKVALCTDFINTFFRHGSSWEEVSKFVVADGEYEHQLLALPSIKAAHACLAGPFIESFPDLMQTVEDVAISAMDPMKVVVTNKASATFRKDWGKIPANNRRWEIPVIWCIQLEETSAGLKIKFASEIANHHNIYQQLQAALFKSQYEQEQEEA